MSLTTKQKLDADPEFARLIDHLPDNVLWKAMPASTEVHPVVNIVPVITRLFVDPVNYIEMNLNVPD